MAGAKPVASARLMPTNRPSTERYRRARREIFLTAAEERVNCSDVYVAASGAAIGAIHRSRGL